MLDQDLQSPYDDPYGGPVADLSSAGDPYAQIRNIYAAVSGGKYTPNDRELTQFGDPSGFDSAYWAKVNGAINDWWKAYQAQQPTTTPTKPTAPTPTPTTSGSGGTSTDPYDDGLTPTVDDALRTVGDVVGRIPTEKDGTLDFYDAPAGFDYPDFHGPAVDVPLPQLTQFHYDDFALPSGQEVLDEDPGYDVREQRGLRAITNNALARGLGKSTGTLKALADYAGSSASQEYASGVDRRFNTWKANRDNALDMWNSGEKNKLTDYALRYGSANDAYQRAEQEWKENLGKAATSYGFGLDVAAGKAGGRSGASSLAGNLALGTGQLALGKSSNLFDHLQSLYELSTRGLPTAPAF